MNWQKTGTIAAAMFFVLEVMSPKHGCSLMVLLALRLENRLTSTPKSYTYILTRSSLRVTAYWLGHSPKKETVVLTVWTRELVTFFPTLKKFKLFSLSSLNSSLVTSLWHSWEQFLCLWVKMAVKNASTLGQNVWNLLTLELSKKVSCYTKTD